MTPTVRVGPTFRTGLTQTVRVGPTFRSGVLLDQ